MMGGGLILLLLSGVSVGLSHADGIRRFKLVRTPKTWLEAQADCRDRFTDLATIQDDTDNREVKKLASRKTVWIGLNRSWKWSPGNQDLTGNTFTNWSQNEPGSGDCVTASLQGWSAKDCNTQNPVLCYNAETQKHFLLDQLKTWSEAQSLCSSLNSHLSHILSQRDTEEISQLLQSAAGPAGGATGTEGTTGGTTEGATGTEGTTGATTGATTGGTPGTEGTTEGTTGGTTGTEGTTGGTPGTEGTTEGTTGGTTGTEGTTGGTTGTEGTTGGTTRGTTGGTTGTGDTTGTGGTKVIGGTTEATMGTESITGTWGVETSVSPETAQVPTQTVPQVSPQVSTSVGIAAWVGLRKRDWAWSDQNPAPYRKWYSGQPDSGADCVHMKARIRAWRTAACSGTRNFICYKAGRHSLVTSLKLRLIGGSDLNSPQLQVAVLQQLEQKLQEGGVGGQVKLRWRKQPDGKVFHREQNQRAPSCDQKGDCVCDRSG